MASQNNKTDLNSSHLLIEKEEPILVNDIQKINEEIKKISEYYRLNDIPLADLLKYLKTQKQEYNEIFEKQRLSLIKDEILKLEKKKIDVENEIARRPSAFGYVGKPIKRFLTHCDDIALDFLHDSINLYLSKTDPFYNNESDFTLPEWFISSFEKWWEEKKSSLSEIRSGGDSYSRNPFLKIDSGHHEILLVIPSQKIQSELTIDEVTFIVHSSSEIISEEEYPLYYENDGYITEEIVIPISEPSDVYYVDLIYPGASMRFSPIELFSGELNYAYFDYETGRLYSRHSDCIEISAYVIFKEQISINPESAVVEYGRLYGSWYGYYYFIIDPHNCENGSVRIGTEIEAGFNLPQKFASISLEDYNILDKIFLNKKSVVSGSPPTLVISLPSLDDLSGYRLSIHPISTGTIDETRFYAYNDFKNNCQIDKSSSICKINLADDYYMGENPVGIFAIRMRNERKNIDQIFEFAIIPKLSYSFSKDLYIPTNKPNPLRLKIICPEFVNFSVKSPIISKKDDLGWIFSGPILKEITGTIYIEITGKNSFNGNFSIPVPHLAWRFENSEKGIVYPINRTNLEISDYLYDELGDAKSLTLFMPEEYNGRGTITLKPDSQYIIKNIINGKAIFPLARFNDILRITNQKELSFILSFETDSKSLEIPLFKLNKWTVSGFNCNVETRDERRFLTMSWSEEGEAQNKKIILWKAASGEGKPRNVSEIPIQSDSNFISFSKERSLILPGLYYAQFVQVRNEWTVGPAIFSGEGTPNLFQFLIEIEGTELLEEGDKLLFSGDYLKAVERYKELESLNKELSGLWKQKIQNTFMYTYRYDEVLNLLRDLMSHRTDLTGTDYAYIAFRLTDIIRAKDLSYETFIKLFQNINVLLKINDQTSKVILSQHIDELKGIIASSPSLNKEQSDELLNLYEKMKTEVKKAVRS